MPQYYFIVKLTAKKTSENPPTEIKFFFQSLKSAVASLCEDGAKKSPSKDEEVQTFFYPFFLGGGELSLVTKIKEKGPVFSP